MSKLTPLPLLACLLLPACAPKDPEGMLKWQQDAKYVGKPAIVIEDPGRGDTPPFRLESGDYQFLLDSGEVSPLSAYECRTTVKLLPHGRGEERTVLDNGRLGFETIRVNSIGKGLYYLQIEGSENYCAPSIIISRI